MADMGNWWSGTPARVEQTPTLSQPQQGLQNQAIQQLMAMLSQQGGSFAPIEQQARTGFNQQTVPGLAERFTSMGGAGSGALSSPAFASQLGQAGSGLEQSLAALKSQHNLGQQGLLSQLGMQPGFENTYHARKPGFGETAGQGIAGGIGAILPLLGLLFGGPAGGAVGGAGSAGLAGLMSLLGGSSNQGQSGSVTYPQQGGGLTNQAFAPKPLNFGGY